MNVTQLQRWQANQISDEDVRRSPTAQAWARGLREKADLQAAQAAEQQAKHDRELADRAAEERARDTVIDISTPELAAEAKAEGLV